MHFINQVYKWTEYGLHRKDKCNSLSISEWIRKTENFKEWFIRNQWNKHPKCVECRNVWRRFFLDSTLDRQTDRQTYWLINWFWFIVIFLLIDSTDILIHDYIGIKHITMIVWNKHTQKQYFMTVVFILIAWTNNVYCLKYKITAINICFAIWLTFFLLWYITTTYQHSNQFVFWWKSSRHEIFHSQWSGPYPPGLGADAPLRFSD